MPKEINKYRVSANTNVRKLSGFIGARLKEEDTIILSVVGSESMNTAIKAVSLLRRHSDSDVKDVSVKPSFDVVKISKKDRDTNGGVDEVVTEVVNVNFNEMEKVDDDMQVSINLLIETIEKAPVLHTETKATEEKKKQKKRRYNPRNRKPRQHATDVPEAKPVRTNQQTS